MYDQQTVIQALERRVGSLLTWKEKATRELQAKDGEFEAWKGGIEKREEQFETWKAETRMEAARKEEELQVWKTEIVDVMSAMAERLAVWERWR